MLFRSVSWRRSAATLRWRSSPTPSAWDRAWNPSRKTEKLPAIGQKSCWRKQPMKNGSMALLPKLSAGQRTAINIAYHKQDGTFRLTKATLLPYKADFRRDYDITRAVSYTHLKRISSIEICQSIPRSGSSHAIAPSL